MTSEKPRDRLARKVAERDEHRARLVELQRGSEECDRQIDAAVEIEDRARAALTALAHHVGRTA